MKIISFWTPKGGAGKTTLALNVGGDLADRGFSVLLCDLDPQGTALDVAALGKLEFDVRSGIPESQPDVDFVLIDHPPGFTQTPKSKIVVVPMRPSFLDFKANQKILRIINDSGNSQRQIVRVINCLDVRRKEEKKFADKLTSKNGSTVAIRNRSIFPRIAGKGKTVFQSGTLFGGGAARDEIRKLTDKILER